MAGERGGRDFRPRDAPGIARAGRRALWWWRRTALGLQVGAARSAALRGQGTAPPLASRRGLRCSQGAWRPAPGGATSECICSALPAQTQGLDLFQSCLILSEACNLNKLSA